MSVTKFLVVSHFIFLLMFYLNVSLCNSSKSTSKRQICVIHYHILLGWRIVQLFPHVTLIIMIVLYMLYVVLNLISSLQIWPK
jgi:hypothetical protein